MTRKESMSFTYSILALMKEIYKDTNKKKNAIKKHIYTLFKEKSITYILPIKKYRIYTN